MSKYFEFPCGCKFKILETKTKHGKTLIEFNPSIEKLDLNCSCTWDMISEGNTKGIFQLESRFGQKTAQDLKPRNIEHLAALISIMRPGCSQSYRDDKTIMKHYIDRKNGIEEVESFHPALEPILSSTYGEMIYQEQSMQVAQKIAGFDLQQADVLRKAIGKKKADVMAEVKIEFIKGCQQQNIVSKEQAAEIFSWIEKSQRYSFNKSHAVSYAINAYLCAYCKAHFPGAFFTSWLFFAKDKSETYDEINQLINNAKLMDIEVNPPDFRYMNSHFQRIFGNIYFGMTDIRGIGDSSVSRMDNAAKSVEELLGKKRDDWSWVEFLVLFSPKIKSDAIVAMIEAGSLAYMKIPRTRMFFEFQLFKSLTKKEHAWIAQNLGNKTLGEILQKMVSIGSGRGMACANRPRLEKIGQILHLYENPPEILEDRIEWVATIEEARLGIPVTVCNVDSCDTSSANCTCKEFIKKEERTNTIFIAAEINEINETVTKNGKNPGSKMAFMNISDNSGQVSCVIFPEEWDKIKAQGLAFKDSLVMVSGERSKDKSSLIVKKIWQLT